MRYTVVLLTYCRLYTKHGVAELNAGDYVEGYVLDPGTLSCRIVNKRRDLIVHEWQATPTGWSKLWRVTTPLEELARAAE